MDKSKPKQKATTARKIYRITIVFTLIYCSVGIALYHLQKEIFVSSGNIAQRFQIQI